MVCRLCQSCTPTHHFYFPFNLHFYFPYIVKLIPFLSYFFKFIENLALLLSSLSCICQHAVRDGVLECVSSAISSKKQLQTSLCAVGRLFHHPQYILSGRKPVSLCARLYFS